MTAGVMALQIITTIIMCVANLAQEGPFQSRMTFDPPATTLLIPDGLSKPTQVYSRCHSPIPKGKIQAF